MANILRGEAAFSADGVDYRLVVDFNAFAEAEDAADMAVDDLLVALTPVMDAGGKIVRKPRIKHVGAMLFGALRAHHPDITLAQATNLLNAGEQVGAAIGKALTGAMPKPVETASAEGKVDAGTGTKPKATGRAKA